MQKTSEWLLSFNTQSYDQINSILKERKNSSKNKAVTISVTGGKGGVGKTSVSLKLAKELSNVGFKTLLIDCDYNLANTAIKLGLPLKNTFYDLLSSEKKFEECLHQDGDFHLLSACNGNLDLFDANFRMEDFIIDIMSAHEEDYDFILLDCPAGITRETLTLNAYCDQRIIIVTPDKSSITDSYSLVKVLSNKFGIKENQLIVNKYEHSRQFEKVVKTLSETIENFLGCRTHILGGVRKLDIKQDKFDDYFLSSAESAFHKNFLKIVSRYAEQLSEPIVNSGSRPQVSINRLSEQEVHI